MMISWLSWHQIIEGVFSDCSHGQPYGSGIWWCCQTTMRCDTSCKSGSRSSSHLVQRRASFSNLQLSDLRSCFESAGLNPMFEKYSWLYQLWSRPAPVMLNRNLSGSSTTVIAITGVTRDNEQTISVSKQDRNPLVGRGCFFLGLLRRLVDAPSLLPSVNFSVPGYPTQNPALFWSRSAITNYRLLWTTSKNGPERE
ncbi:unnamed protein product [Nesidiocoris tenuis]|uniref:Uncharacterized protein n=1 Tax=Nesidiocoris tenuis TaxID=355587 RepID=A0A6H5GN53_9HEMI|nr:unnamed protein product [Nesidiocoris tenuis]